jgi:hypothetical protein
MRTLAKAVIGATPRQVSGRFCWWPDGDPSTKPGAVHTDLETDPAITTQPDPPGWLATHHTTWRIDRDTEDEQRHQAALAAEHAAAERATHDRTYHHRRSPSQHMTGTAPASDAEDKREPSPGPTPPRASQCTWPRP